MACVDDVPHRPLAAMIEGTASPGPTTIYEAVHRRRRPFPILQPEDVVSETSTASATPLRISGATLQIPLRSRRKNAMHLSGGWSTAVPRRRHEYPMM